METGNDSPENEKKVLTSIHGAYTLSNTREDDNELEKLMVANFLDYLAEVALAVAARRGGQLKGEDGNGNGATKGSSLYKGF